MKSLQLSALKSAERFVLAEIEQREAGGPSEYLSDALNTKRIIQHAIVAGELEPDVRVEMLEALKGVVAVAGRKTVEFDRARDVIRRAER